MSLDVYLRLNKCSHCGRYDEIWQANITHNLTDMADAAGIYGIVWSPDENGIERAHQIIEPLRKAIADMKARPEFYERYNAKNGWGTYKCFVPWLERYLKACEDNPEAFITVSR